MLHRLLIIDDDSRIHALIKAQFDAAHFEIASAFKGESGIDAAAQSMPDLILLDVDLPETQGFEICRRLKADPTTRSIPIIFLTARNNVEATIFGLESGASDFLTKPFHANELLARVRNVLRLNVIDPAAIPDSPGPGLAA